MHQNLLNMSVVIVCLGILVFCQFRLINARKQLTSEQKAKLLDSYSQIGKSHIAIIFIFFAACFALTQYNHSDLVSLLSWSIFILAVILLKIWRAISSHRQLKAEGFPPSYFKAVGLYSFISYIAVIGFVLSLIFFPDLPK